MSYYTTLGSTTEPIEVDTDYEPVDTSATSPWGSLIGAFTGIGGLVLSVFEGYYQRKMQAGDNYGNSMITDASQQLSQLEQEASYYQSAAMQQNQLASSYNNQVFSAPNKSYRSHYQQLLDSTSQKRVYYDELASMMKAEMSKVEKQIKQDQKQENDFSFGTSSEDGKNGQFKQHLVNVHEDEIRKEAKSDRSILSQIIQLQKTISSGNLTLSQLKSAINEVNKLNTQMEANNKGMNGSPSFMVKPMTGVLKSVTNVLKTAIEQKKKVAKTTHADKKKKSAVEISLKKPKVAPMTDTRKRPIKH